MSHHATGPIISTPTRITATTSPIGSAYEARSTHQANTVQTSTASPFAVSSLALSRHLSPWLRFVAMGDEPTQIRRLIEDMPQECRSWRNFGLGLAAFCAANAFMVWATVRTYPEQDLPLWPAWIFAALGCAGLVLTVATVLRLPPFRGSRPHRDLR